MTVIFLRSPALHFALIGLLAFVFIDDDRNASDLSDGGVEIPWTRAQMVYDQLAKEKGAPLTKQDEAEADQLMMDNEALYLYSRDIGLDADPVVQRRLALIAQFVAETPDEGLTTTVEESARQAQDFGLMDGDPVTRRLMIDGAQRMIRGTVLALQPDEASMEEYLQEHAEDFQMPALARITHVTMNPSVRGDRARRDAEKLLTRLRSENIAPEEAETMGDPVVIEPALPLISDSALERRFGHDFAIALAELPVGSWQGPIRSRLGEHLVFIEERIDARTATLDEARIEVSSKMRNENADRVLRARLDQLHAKYQIRIQGPS